MVEIIEEGSNSYAEDEVFVFKVYKSPKDGESILGYLEPFGAVHPDGKTVTWFSTPFGVPVKEAFANTLALASEHNITAVLVYDPDRLFPEDAR